MLSYKLCRQNHKNFVYNFQEGICQQRITRRIYQQRTIFRICMQNNKDCSFGLIRKKTNIYLWCPLLLFSCNCIEFPYEFLSKPTNTNLCKRFRISLITLSSQKAKIMKLTWSHKMTWALEHVPENDQF